TVRRWTLQVHPWARRIGADDGKICTCGNALVPGACGQDRDIAGGDIELAAVITAEAHAGVPARDAQHLMHGRGIMRKVVDAVPPHAAPAVLRKQHLDGALGLGAADHDRAPVDQERHRIVRYEAVVLEMKGERLEYCASDGHDLLLKKISRRSTDR